MAGTQQSETMLVAYFVFHEVTLMCFFPHYPCTDCYLRAGVQSFLFIGSRLANSQLLRWAFTQPNRNDYAQLTSKSSH